MRQPTHPSLVILFACLTTGFKAHQQQASSSGVRCDTPQTDRCTHMRHVCRLRLTRPPLFALSGGSAQGCDAKYSSARASSLSNPRNISLASLQASLDFYVTLRSCNDSYVTERVTKSLDMLSDALRLYGPSRLFSSYNGGKDAVVIMHLVRAAVAKYSVDTGTVYRPRLIYFQQKDEFEQVKKLVNDTELKYDLELKRFSCGFSEGLSRCIEEEGGGAFGFVLGTRKGDPNSGEQEHFSPSSSWMPPFMRINPILDWDYGHIWHFLRTFNLEYCALYDEGYTSLGKKTDTSPNPFLLRRDGASYWPAYMLSDWTQERAGRGLSLESPIEVTHLRQAREHKVEMAKSAGLIVIGDEILKGHTADTNTAVAAAYMRETGIQLLRVGVVSDDMSDIADEVRRHIQRYDVVFTSGGVGPTHDDVTMRAVASAMGQRLVLNTELLEFIKKAYGHNHTHAYTPDDEAYNKMAMLPEFARLRWIPETGTNSDKGGADVNGNKKSTLQWPIVQCENVFILPGVPQFFESKLRSIARYFLTKQQSFETRKVLLDVEESKIVTRLNTLVERHSAVKFGSYPFVGQPEFKTIITLEGQDELAVEDALRDVLDTLPNVVRVQGNEFITRLPTTTPVQM